MVRIQKRGFLSGYLKLRTLSPGFDEKLSLCSERELGEKLGWEGDHLPEILSVWLDNIMWAFLLDQGGVRGAAGPLV